MSIDFKVTFNSLQRFIALFVPRPGIVIANMFLLSMFIILNALWHEISARVESSPPLIPKIILSCFM